MTKAKQDKMKCLFYSITLNLNHREIAKEKMLVALMTISAAISSPVNGMFTTILQKLVKLAESHLIGHPEGFLFLTGVRV